MRLTIEPPFESDELLAAKHAERRMADA